MFTGGKIMGCSAVGFHVVYFDFITILCCVLSGYGCG